MGYSSLEGYDQHMCMYVCVGVFVYLNEMD